MSKTILLTGATDGIGLEAAKMMLSQGHHLLIHGRNAQKIDHVKSHLLSEFPSASIDSYLADLSNLDEVVALSDQIRANHQHLDAIVNNAGVFHVNPTESIQGFDVRFAVNTFAPVLLTERLMPLLTAHSRVVNLSSAAQASVDLTAMLHHKPLTPNAAYAQSKLALTIWSRIAGLAHRERGPMIVSINPKSFLGSKMVKEAYGVAGGDLRLGADIICRAALSDEFSDAHGQYYDNDIEDFSAPHPDALDEASSNAVYQGIMQAIEPWLD